MRTINISRLKQQWHKLLDELDHEGIVITRHGKPVARLVPAGSTCADLIGNMKGTIQIHGDILSTVLKWNAES